MFTLKGVISEQELIEDDSNRPEISLKAIRKTRHYFRGHVENSTTGGFSCIFYHLCESKVANLAGIGVIFVSEEKNVLGLEIAVHDIATMNGLGSVQYLRKYPARFAEIECFFVYFSLIIMEVAHIAVFHD